MIVQLDSGYLDDCLVVQLESGVGQLSSWKVDSWIVPWSDRLGGWVVEQVDGLRGQMVAWSDSWMVKKLEKLGRCDDGFHHPG